MLEKNITYQWCKLQKRLQQKVEDVGAEYDLMNNLGFNLCYHKWSLTICDGCFDTSKSSKMQSKASDKRCC